MPRFCLFPSFQSKLPRALLLFFSFLLTLLHCNAISEEGRILLQIKENEWNDTHDALSNWNASHENPCGWNGVFCNGFNVVTKVNLSNTSIAGILTSTICALQNLTDLILQSNDFRGAFPDGLFACKHLQMLDLSVNLFLGSLPDNIHELGELSQLNLVFNNFSGFIPPGFGMLLNLKTLWLGNNLVSGSIPSFLGNLTELESLDLSKNKLSGNIPTSLMRLSKMTELYLWSNQLSGQIPHNIDGLRSIRFLDFSANQLNGMIPETIANLTHLETLALWENSLTGPVPAQLGMLVNLTSLDLSSNKLTGWLPQNLGTHSDLWLLEVSENNFSGPLPRNLCERRNLYALVIFSNNFNGSLQCLESCSSLLYVQLYRNQLSGEVPLALWSSPKLVQLAIYNNMFEGHIPEEIGGASKLVSLEMANNRFSEIIPSQIGQLRNLVLFNATNNRLSGTLPPQIGQLTNLITFTASNNRLLGSLPDELAGLSSIIKLQLDHNLLSGEIPKGIISMGQLSELNLANNQLTGEIPAWLGSMSNLIALDLSNNRLEGIIPPELGHLWFEIFNVSDNRLSGPIPYSFQVSAYKDSFLGNSDLCGYPASTLRLKSCSSTHGFSLLHHKLLIILVPILVVGISIILFSCLIYLGCFNTNNRVRNFFLGRPSISTSSEVTYFNLGLELDESYILQHLTENNVIGSGGAGKVYKVTLRNRQEVAVKKILKNKREYEAEVETLGLIRHSNILRLLCCISSADSDLRLLVFEYIQNGSLFERLHGSESMATLEWPLRQKIAVGVARGLYYLHNDCRPPILHRDVKSSNILLDSEFEAKIADFGVAKRKLSHHHPLESRGDGLTISSFTGSHGYIAPEYCMGMKVNEKSDVYSFGVVVLELVTGKRATGEIEYGESLNIVGWIRSKLMCGEPDERGVVLYQEEQGILDWRILQSEDLSGRCRQKMLAMLEVGLLCTNNLPNRRPSMGQVLHMLQSI